MVTTEGCTDEQHRLHPRTLCSFASLFLALGVKDADDLLAEAALRLSRGALHVQHHWVAFHLPSVWCDAVVRFWYRWLYCIQTKTKLSAGFLRSGRAAIRTNTKHNKNRKPPHRLASRRFLQPLDPLRQKMLSFWKFGQLWLRKNAPTLLSIDTCVRRGIKITERVPSPTEYFGE